MQHTLHLSSQCCWSRIWTFFNMDPDRTLIRIRIQAEKDSAPRDMKNMKNVDFPRFMKKKIYFLIHWKGNPSLYSNHQKRKYIFKLLNYRYHFSMKKNNANMEYKNKILFSLVFRICIRFYADPGPDPVGISLCGSVRFWKTGSQLGLPVFSVLNGFCRIRMRYHCKR